MKKSIFLMSLLMATSVMTFGQSTEKTLAFNEQSMPSANFNWLKTQTIDLGKVAKGKPVTVVFEFENTGNQDLLISSAKGECGCTSVEYSKQAIEPNGKGYVKATYNAANAGFFKKGITVYSNAKDAKVQLSITGEVN